MAAESATDRDTAGGAAAQAFERRADPPHAQGRIGANLLQLGVAAVDAADPMRAVARHLPPPPARGRVAVFSLGKAAVPMARAVETAWGGLGGRLSGVVVTNDAAGAAFARFEVLEASHPTPDARSAEAARRLLALAAELGEEDLALALISGGGSALAAAPISGLTLEAKQAINDALLASGATIHEINTVRKRLSAIKGGRLATAIHPARLITLALSDVPGDDPAVIASGPTAPDPTTNADASAVIEKYGLAGAGPTRSAGALAPPRQLAPGETGAPVRPDLSGRGQEAFHLVRQRALAPDALQETPSPSEPVFARAVYDIVASPAASIAAAVRAAKALGWRPVLLGETIEGEARKVARAHAERALAEVDAVVQSGASVALISGGELTVTIAGDGRGGPNREYALALALALAGNPQISALAMDTDGADGAPGPDGSPIAGALIFPDTLARAAEIGLDLADALARNDAGGAFAALGDDLRMGYTGTNVNDLRVILISPPARRRA